MRVPAVWIAMVLMSSGCQPRPVEYQHPRPGFADDPEARNSAELDAAFPPGSRSILRTTIVLSSEHPRHIVPVSPLDHEALMYDIELISVAPNGRVTINSNGLRRIAHPGESFEGSGTSGLRLLESDPQKQTAIIEARWRYWRPEDGQDGMRRNRRSANTLRDFLRPSGSDRRSAPSLSTGLVEHDKDMEIAVPSR